MGDTEVRPIAPAAAASFAARPPLVYLYLAIIVVSWAANWPLMKLALAEAPPLAFVLLRLFGTVLVMAPMLLAMRAPLVPLRGERLRLFWVGELQMAGFMVCGMIGLALVPAGRAIVLAFTMPLWAIPLELRHGFAGRRHYQLLGAAIGFAGLLLFMNPGLVDWRDPRIVGGNLMLLGAAICWALGSVIYRRRRWRSGFWTQTFWQVAVSSVAVAAIAAPEMTGQPIGWSPVLLGVLAYNWLITTALGYFLWNKVLVAMPAATAGQIMTLTPILGFLLSTAVFGGAISWDVVLSIALIIAGIVVSLRA